MTKFHKKHDVIPAYLAIMAGVGLLVGSAAFAFAFGFVLVIYLFFKRKPRPITTSENGAENADDKVLREWDEQVKKNGGYSVEKWNKAMKDRDKP